MERIAKQEHENTFKPTINKRSERIANRVKNLNEEKKSLVRVPCPHCGRKFAQERLEKHE